MLGSVCKTLPCFDDAHRKSQGWLVPHALQNFARIAEDLEGLLIKLPKCAEAVEGERLSAALANEAVSVAARLCPDRLHGGIGHASGKDMDWQGFIEKVRTCRLISTCKASLVKHVRPFIDQTKAAMTLLSNFEGWEPNEENKIALDLLILENVDESIGNLNKYAANSGDIALQAQLAQFANMMNLGKTAAVAMTWHLEGFVHFHTSAVPMASNLRRAVRTSRAQIPELSNIFKKTGDVSHIIDFDDELFATYFKRFINGAESLNERIAKLWREEITDATNDIEPKIPAWTPETMFDEEVAKRMLKNLHFAALGETANKLFTMLDVTKFGLLYLEGSALPARPKHNKGKYEIDS